MLGFCKNCKQLKEICSRFLCSACYYRKKRGNKLGKFPKKGKNKVCVECKKQKKKIIKGVCTTCRSKNKIFQIQTPKGRRSILTPSTDEAKTFYKKRQEELLEDIKNNPRKWLDTIK